MVTIALWEMAQKRDDPLRTVDVVVVGGGPAGSSTAAMLAARGFEVLLIDKHQAGWQKPCGGYLPAKITRRVSLQRLEGVNLLSIDTVNLLSPGASQISVCGERQIGYMVERGEFDQALLKQAAALGVWVERGMTVRDLRQHSDYVKVTTDKNSVLARYVVGADGVHSTTARASGIRERFPRWQTALSYVARLRWLEEPRGWSNSAIQLFCFPVAGGMGWAFPLPGGVNLGVAGSALDQRQVASHFERLLQHIGGYARFLLESKRGWYLPAGGIPRRLGRGRVLLTGDAAGFVDCFCGEGIHYALHSGQLAAHAISAGYTEPGAVQTLYGRYCNAEITPTLRASLFFSGLLWRKKAWYHRALQHRPELATHLLDLMSNEFPYRGLLLPMTAALLMSALRRAHGDSIRVCPAETRVFDFDID